ncbi:hypothetical protein JW824_11540 [bacterium]|nr:hypothetical protein [bacterium]
MILMNEISTKEQIETEALIRNARSGDKSAENLFYSHLIVRFLPVVKCEIGRYSLLEKEVKYRDETIREICEEAIEEIKTLCPIDSAHWSLIRAMHILRNITEDFIMNTLFNLARNGNLEAENQLFSIIRKKLIQWIESKNWKAST